MASRSLRELRQMGVAPRNTPFTTAPTVQRGMSGMVGRIAERVKRQPVSPAPQAQKQPLAPPVRTPRVRRGIY